MVARITEEDEVKDLKLTEEELNSEEYYRSLSPERKEELKELVYELSLILYGNYAEKENNTDLIKVISFSSEDETIIEPTFQRNVRCFEPLR